MVNEYLLSLYRENKGLFRRLALFLSIGNLISALSPLFLREVPSHPAIALLLVVLLLLSIYLKYEVRRNFNHFSSKKEEGVKRELFSFLQHQKEPFFQEHPPGSLLNLFTSDLPHYRDFLYIGLFAPMNLISLSIPSLIISFTLSWQLTLLSLIPLLGIPFIMWVSLRSIDKRNTDLKEHFDEWNTFLLDVLKGIRGLKHPVAKEKLFSFAEKQTDAIRKVSFPLRLLESTFVPIVNVFSRGSTLLFALGALFLASIEYLPLFNFLSFLWIQGNLLVPILFLGWSLPIIFRGEASLRRINSILKSSPSKPSAPFLKGSGIQIKNLSFNYPKREIQLFSNLNLKLENPSLSVISGAVGAGKTSLFRLILGNWPIDSGEITRPSSVGYAEQTPFIFTGTLRENLLLASPHATEKELEQVLFASGLDREIKGFNEGLQTVVGERGMTLSGGQKRRIALARALLSNRDLLLIDDPFSALDPATAKRVGESLVELSKRKTVFVATNHVPFLYFADHLFYLSQGKIIQEGGKDLLIKEEGPFYHLRRLHETLHR